MIKTCPICEKSFSTNHPKNSTTYTPDFFIHETGEFIEVKGWWRGDAKAKVELFQSDYPGLPFDVISGSKYSERGR